MVGRPPRASLTLAFPWSSLILFRWWPSGSVAQLRRGLVIVTVSGTLRVGDVRRPVDARNPAGVSGRTTSMGSVHPPRSYHAPYRAPPAPAVAVAAPAVAMSAPPAAKVASFAPIMPDVDICLWHEGA